MTVDICCLLSKTHFFFLFFFISSSNSLTSTYIILGVGTKHRPTRKTNQNGSYV
ncbi:unnamed protein product [Meloidogyne enterolobii]|uniref:Uncharacterized protein n=1 Tax=Meloidogyne enterolobii TaxID=390850 RepID=A0ACB0YTH2_MELEN